MPNVEASSEPNAHPWRGLCIVYCPFTPIHKQQQEQEQHRWKTSYFAYVLHEATWFAYNRNKTNTLNESDEKKTQRKSHIFHKRRAPCIRNLLVANASKFIASFNVILRSTSPVQAHNAYRFQQRFAFAIQNLFCWLSAWKPLYTVVREYSISIDRH